MREIFGGALLVVAGIAAFIEAHSHHPWEYEGWGPGGKAPYGLHHVGLSQSSYDLVHIAAWALVIFGGLLIVVGLIRFWSATREGRTA
jgi:hypothetical protein